MTIDTGWTKLIKRNVPQAFSHKLQDKPTTVFIDGQIKLMCGSHIRSWSQLVRQQFLQCIDAAFQTGACIVVLAFDNYEHVPSAKNMTQAKRSKQHVNINFDDSDDLPAHMPENWSAAMRNRGFKTKVMHMIVNTLRMHFTESNTLQKNGRTLILDFVKPEVLGTKVDLPHFADEEFRKRGECDIKAFRWSCYGPLLIFSTDGDYLMIALMQLERLQKTESMTADNSFLAPAVLQTDLRIKPKNRALQHQEYISEADGETWLAQRPLHMQQFYLWRMTTNVDNGVKRKADEKTQQKFEYVNIQMILPWVQQEMAGIGCVGLASDNLAALVAATGCDFCMSLPNIGPIKIWQQRFKFKHLNLTSPLDLLQALSHVYLALYSAKVPGTASRLTTAMQQAKLATDKPEAYYDNFQNCQKFTTDMQEAAQAYAVLAQQIKSNPNISESIKNRIWQVERMQAHVLNAIWTTRYWMFLDLFPDPLSGFGYVKHGNRVEFQAAV